MCSVGKSGSGRAASHRRRTLATEVRSTAAARLLRKGRRPLSKASLRLNTSLFLTGEVKRPGVVRPPLLARKRRESKRTLGASPRRARSCRCVRKLELDE